VQGETGDAEKIPDSYTELEVKCGPLLNYRRMENQTWFGSVLIVTKGGGLGGGPEPTLVWTAGPSGRASGTAPPLNGSTNGSNGASGEPHGTVNGVDYSSSQNPEANPQASSKSNGLAHDGERDESKVPGTKLYSDPANTFWRFDLQVPMDQSELECKYRIPGLTFTQGTKRDEQSFFIPAISESMRIMFHSCNGFSVGTDEDAWSGAALWNDVQRVHQTTPFHVMQVSVSSSSIPAKLSPGWAEVTKSTMTVSVLAAPFANGPTLEFPIRERNILSQRSCEESVMTSMSTITSDGKRINALI
jgi:hypothetical protein